MLSPPRGLPEVVPRNVSRAKPPQPQHQLNFSYQTSQPPAREQLDGVVRSPLQASYHTKANSMQIHGPTASAQVASAARQSSNLLNPAQASLTLQSL